MSFSIYPKFREYWICFLRRKNGKDKFWKADPKVKWMLLKESTQQTLNI